MSTSLLSRSTLPLLSRSIPRLVVTAKKATAFSLWVGPSSSVQSTPRSSSLIKPFSSTPSMDTPSTPQGALSTNPTPEKIVQDSLKKDYISVYSKSWCPYCKRAKNALADLTLPPGKEIKVFELDDMDDGADIQDYLQDLTGQRSVPNIFVQGVHLGGSDDLSAARENGRLASMMEIKP